jgi:hypothetical protein
VTVERWGESCAKARAAKLMLREREFTQQQIADGVGTSRSQVQRFADEEDHDPRERWVRPDLPRTRAEVAALKRRDHDDLVAEVARLLEENEALRRRGDA